MMEATLTERVNERGEVSRTPGIDPFDHVTIAAACQVIYRELFLEEEYETYVTDVTTKKTSKRPTKFENGVKRIQLPNGEWRTTDTVDSSRYQTGKTVFVKSPIALVPSEGYNTDAFSKESIQWLEWTMEKSKRNGTRLQIKHALNGGEHSVPGTRYRLDGYDEETKTAYEFQGCVFHGCIDCFPLERTTTKHPITNHTMGELYYMTRQKELCLKRLGYKYVCIWEHQYLQQMKKDDDMKAYVSKLDISDRLNARESFFGGRTNALKLYHEVKEAGETIEYYDFTSLYPSVNKYAKYPVGHPEIITSNFKPISSYFGLAKVNILAPRKNLLHPVLPYLSNGKLKFPLCKKCADNENQDDCSCQDSERAITGTWCTPELELALSKGYQILKIYEVYHFSKRSQYDRTSGTGGLFAGYVDLFLRFKQQSSNFPYECKTEEQKMDYIAKYAEKEGVQLDYKIRKNPALRTLAKICLNSFWGKFGQRLNMKQTSFMYENEADKFFQLISDPKKDVHDFHIISDSIIDVEYLNHPSFLPMDFKTNVFLASFTTAWARIRLYSLLELTQERALYVDTDSIIYVDR